MAKSSMKSSKKKDTAAAAPVTEPEVETTAGDYLEADMTPIAQPFAGKKLTKKLLKTIKKACKERQIKRGVKEVVKGLRKGSKGFVVIAADISPMDVISHLPVLCEENDVPYVFVPSKLALGEAAMTKRPTSVIMTVTPAKDDAAYKKYFDECLSETKTLA